MNGVEQCCRGAAHQGEEPHNDDDDKNTSFGAHDVGFDWKHDGYIPVNRNVSTFNTYLNKYN